LKFDPSATATLAPAPRNLAAAAYTLVVVHEGERKEIPLPSRGSIVLGRAEDCDVCIPHRTLSRRHVEIAVGDAVSICDLGSKNGTRLRALRLEAHARAEVLPGDEQVPGEIFEPGALVCYVKARVAGAAVPGLLLRPKANSETPRIASTSSRADGLVEPVIQDPAMQRIYSLLERIAPGDISVLLLGETGVGKEVAARSIHARSKRAGGPFLAINCAALSPALLESELFGHERGAFTGAHASKEGIFEAASGGTVMLDEVGELPQAVQAALLRVIEERTVMRVGSTKVRHVDVRLVAATNRDLGAEVERGSFRRDLYFRLNGISLQIPPLRERKDEILPLALGFLAKTANAAQTLTQEAEQALLAWSWPGNVREVRNVIDRAALLAGDGPVEAAHLGLPGPSTADMPASAGRSARVTLGAANAESLRGELDAIERQRIVAALDRAGGNQTRAAAELGMPRRTFVSRLDAYGVPRPRRR